jgi:hypothetical protein
MGVLDNLQVSTLSSDEEVMNDENNEMDDQCNFILLIIIHLKIYVTYLII